MAQSVILLGEDNPAESELMQIALRRISFDCELVLVEDGQAVLDFVFRKGAFAGDERPMELRLVILDLGLPVVAGEEVLRLLKTDPRSRHLPVVVLSSSDHPPQVARAYQAGANAFLRKPVELSAFVDLVGATVRFWLSPDLVLAQRNGVS